MSFAEASAVSGGPGRWKADLPQGWDIFEVTNGGLLMAIATRAMEAETAGRELISATGSYVNPAGKGSIDVEVLKLKSGRSLSTLRATLSRDGKDLVYVTGVFAEPERPRPEQDLIEGGPPDLPAPDDCLRAVPSETAPLPPPFTGKVDVRIHPDDAGLFTGEPGEDAVMRGWFRLLDGEAFDAHAVVLATDALPPAIFNSQYPAGWTPTVDLTVQVRNPSPRGWLACMFTTRFATDGMLEEDGELWDESGRLVALSRQLALVPR
ncbi:MAG TPA: thioesterase family protein [Acidimicrobiia bacterium]|nr:thioesterase family protein [Acidimicrobiia bacterium]